jgi:hypothetical protein
MSTTATKTYYARVIWGGNQQEWVFSCDEATMQSLRTGMLDGRSVSVINGDMETILNPAHIAKLEFQPAAS